LSDASIRKSALQNEVIPSRQSHRRPSVWYLSRRSAEIRTYTPLSSQTHTNKQPGFAQLLETVKKGKPFLTKGLRPAAAHKSSARSERFSRLQAEKYFLPRTHPRVRSLVPSGQFTLRRAKKCLIFILLLRQQNSTRFFDKLKQPGKARLLQQNRSLKTV